MKKFLKVHEIENEKIVPTEKGGVAIVVVNENGKRHDERFAPVIPGVLWILNLPWGDRFLLKNGNRNYLIETNEVNIISKILENPSKFKDKSFYDLTTDQEVLQEMSEEEIEEETLESNLRM